MGSPVLLVCEDAAVSGPAMAALKSRDVTPIVCTPMKCVAEAAASSPEMILLDLETKSLGWDVVLSALFQESRTRTIPVVGLGRVRADHVLSVLAGMHDVLVLPLDGEKLDALGVLLLTLPFQFGVGGSTPGSADADRLILYAERAKLSGTLVRSASAGAAGRGEFVAGTLSSCAFAGMTGRRALAALLSARGDLRFDTGITPPGVVDVAPLEPLDASQLEEIEPIPPAPRTGVPATILVVDDDPTFLGLLTTHLSRAGFHVLTAGDGEDGYRATLQARPDIVVADLEMPILDGWGLLWKIRGDHSIADTPVLFLSGAEDFRMAMQASAAGARDYLMKGRYRDELTGRLDAVLAPRRELEAGIARARAVRTRVELVGSRWTLLRFAAIAARGVVVAADGFGHYEIAFEEGQLRSATASMGGASLTGPDALAGFVSIRSGDLALGHTPARESNIAGPVVAGVEVAAARNNEDENNAITAAFSSGRKLRVDRALCDLYLRFGSTTGRGIAYAVASGATPMDLVNSGSHTVAELDPILRDLVRRRVILV